MSTNALRISCFSALLALFVALVPNTAQAQLGIAAGANFDRLSDIDANTDGALGYHVGLFYDARLGPLGIRPGVFYMDVGDIGFGNGEEPAAEDFDLQLVEIPIDARLRLGTTPVLTPYLLAGPVFRINASGDDFGGNVEDFSLAANAGVGLEVNVQGTGLRLFPELRYSFGVNDIATDLGVEGEEARLNNFMIRLGLTF